MDYKTVDTRHAWALAYAKKTTNCNVCQLKIYVHLTTLETERLDLAFKVEKNMFIYHKNIILNPTLEKIHQTLQEQNIPDVRKVVKTVSNCGTQIVQTPKLIPVNYKIVCDRNQVEALTKTLTEWEKTTQDMGKLSQILNAAPNETTRWIDTREQHADETWF